MSLATEQSQSFHAQVFSATLSLLRYAVLSHLNEAENTGSKGILFEHLADEAAQVTYVQRRISLSYYLVCFGCRADQNLI